MKLTWTIAAAPPGAEEMWIGDEKDGVGFLVTNWGGPWRVLAIDRRGPEEIAHMHPCASMREGKKLAEDAARKCVQ
jgi:hypothetical protein